MPPKAKLPAPIDRPISRAYLREFTGWSTAYPPGVSDSTSLRIMENMMIQRDGSIRIRPGLRFISYEDAPTEAEPTGFAFGLPVVGTHEPFFLNDGSKAYLFAVRELSGRVGFRVLATTTFFDGTVGQRVVSLTEARFDVPQGEEPAVEPDDPDDYKGVNFLAGTTYVKYLQIDNKVFALSNNGEPMRLFYVGTDKKVKRLFSINRPEWTNEDKLTVMQPDSGWLSAITPLSTRTNLLTNPTFETNTTGWSTHAAATTLVRSDVQHLGGTWSLRVTSTPERTNVVKAPLHDPVTTGTIGWTNVGGTMSVDTTLNALKLTLSAGSIGANDYVRTDMLDVTAGKEYDVAYNVASLSNVRRIWVRAQFFNSAGVQVGSTITYPDNSLSVGRKSAANVKPPTGATQAKLLFSAERKTSSGTDSFSIKNVVMCLEAEDSAMFSGESGANYYWTGAVNKSASVYHPPKDISVKASAATPPGTYTASANVRGDTPRATSITLQTSSSSAVLVTDNGLDVNDTTTGWTRIQNTVTAPASSTTTAMIVWIRAVARGEYHYIDRCLVEKSATMGVYFDGSYADTPTVIHAWTGTAHASTSTEKTYDAAALLPTPETKTPDTLVSSVSKDNTFSFAFFYTFFSEIGESNASAITVVRCQRAWSAWRWETPNAAGEPSGTITNDATQAADQLAAYIPQEAFDEGIDSGAIGWNLYMYTWSDQDPVPVMAMRIGTRSLTPTSIRAQDGVMRATPSQSDAGTEVMIAPTKATRHNFTDPPTGGQGLVAADRMVIVNDPLDPAKIKWTSNQQASYTDFSSSRGGGFKTLTSGNLFIPSCVKLWQNPQSTDTLTVLCRGVDGYNTGYYMAPSNVASQSEQTQIMGFEETTATPGTTSPYGCEVFNNALYHPLDDQLMKSSATNYNINHKSQTDMIENVWKSLTRKEWIISSVHDNRIFYIVNNPAGAPIENGCNGNEIWVFDGGASSDKGGGSWSRWTVQAHSLRKVEQSGMIHMSVVRPDGIYYFDELYGRDDYVLPDQRIASKGIPWKMETNTQGANRAHDAFAHLQQANITVGNFTGNMCFGIRGYNVHGKRVDVSKHLSDIEPTDDLMFDYEAFLLIRQDMKEWFFYAYSETDDAGNVIPSFGEINLVQYRYSPVSVNVGYEYGSIETFEYGRAERLDAQLIRDELTTNGVPRPYVDTGRP